MRFSSCGDSRELMVLAVALSVLLSQDRDQDEIGKLAAFFTVVGDTLALFALQPGLFRCPPGKGDVSVQNTPEVPPSAP